MKKHLRLCAAMCLVLGMCLVLAACSSSDSNVSDGSGNSSGSSDTEPVTSGTEVADVNFGDSEVHEELDRLEFEPGETVDNVYYKRTTDPETNTPAYMVKRSSDGEYCYLPLSKTVCYVDETLGDRAYYEKVSLSYVQDGQQIDTYQYQVFTSVFAPGDDGSRYAEAQNHEANLAENSDSSSVENQEGQDQ